MKIGTKGRYAVMAMIDLARFGSRGTPVSLSDVSQRQEISLSYLEQLFGRLRRHGLVVSTRGALGGYRLNHAPEAISIADIVKAADEPVKLTRCSAAGHEGCMSDKTQCLAHHLWEELENQMMGYLSRVSLKNVLERNVGSIQSEAPLNHSVFLGEVV